MTIVAFIVGAMLAINAFIVGAKLAINAEVEIEGYKIFRLDRKDKRGGGVCAYIRSPLKAQILKDLSGTSTTWFQQLWVQVQYKKIRSFVICAVYRPPDCHVSCF